MIANLDLEHGPHIAYSDPDKLAERAWFTKLGVVDMPNPYGYGEGAVTPIGNPWRPSETELLQLQATPACNPAHVVRLVRVPFARSFGRAVVATSRDPHHVNSHSGPPVFLAGGVVAYIDGLNVNNYPGAPTVTTAPDKVHPTASVVAGERMGLHPDRWYPPNGRHHLMLDLKSHGKGNGPASRDFLRQALVVLGITTDDLRPLVKGGAPTYLDFRRQFASGELGGVVGLLLDHGRLERDNEGWINYEAWAADTDAVVHDAVAISQGLVRVGAAFIEMSELVKLESVI